MNFLSTPRKRIVLFSLLYASEGAPIGFIWWTLPTELRSLGFPVDDITALTSLLVFPWALKFLWAPLVDYVRSPQWTLRSWIISAQMVMGVSLLPILFIESTGNDTFIAALLLLHTFAAATQDAAIDALCISEVPASEHGTINGWMQTGMLSGRALFGGGAIVATQHIDIQAVAGALILFILTISSIVYFTQPQSVQYPDGEQGRSGTFIAHIRKMLRSRTLWMGLLFAVTGGIAYESVGAVAGPFFVDHHFSKDEIGLFFSVLSIGAMLTGALTGGSMARLYGVFAVSRGSVILIGSIVLTLSALLTPGNSVGTNSLMAVMTLLYFGIGLFTASTYAMFMTITDPRLGATQFSTYMGGTNMCESLSASAVGTLVAQSGYAAAFAVMALASLASLVILHRLEKGSSVLKSQHT